MLFTSLASGFGNPEVASYLPTIGVTGPFIFFFSYTPTQQRHKKMYYFLPTPRYLKGEISRLTCGPPAFQRDPLFFPHNHPQIWSSCTVKTLAAAFPRELKTNHGYMSTM